MIYLDHAATASPLSQSVRLRVASLLATPLGNPGRSGHPLSLAAAELILDARLILSRLVGLDRPENLVLTSGATAALNIAIQGTVAALEKRGIRPLVLSDLWEHNAVLRPLFLLEKQGRIRLKLLDGAEMETLAHTAPEAHLAVFTARSNVTGREWCLPRYTRLLRERGTVVIADGAQKIGHAPCTFSDLGADLICAPGHKGLGGLAGAGFLAVREDSPLLPEPILAGGSGSDSFNPFMPEHLPERLEAGTLPLIPIAAMAEGAAERLRMDLGAVDRRERLLKGELKNALSSLSDVILYEKECPAGPLSLNLSGRRPEAVAQRLSELGLFVRAGFHCAPLVHRVLGCEDSGTLRFSFSPATSLSQIRKAAEILSKVAKENDR